MEENMDKLNWPTAFVIGITFISGTIIASSSINARDVAGAGGETLFKQIVAVLDNSHVFQTGAKGKARLCDVSSLEKFKCTNWLN